MEINKLLKLANYFYKMATPLESLVIHPSVDQLIRENIKIEDYEKHYEDTTVNYRIIFIDNNKFKLITARSELAYSIEEIENMIIDHDIIATLDNVSHMKDEQIQEEIKKYKEGKDIDLMIKDLMIKDLHLNFLKAGKGDQVNINIISPANSGDTISPAAIDHDIAHAVLHAFNEGLISKKNKMKEIGPLLNDAIQADFNFPDDMKVNDTLRNSMLRMILIGSNIIPGSVGELNFSRGNDIDLMPDMFAIYNKKGENKKGESFNNINIKSPGLYIHENGYGYGNKTVSLNSKGGKLLAPKNSSGELINLKKLLLEGQEGILNQQAQEIKDHLIKLNGKVIVLRSLQSEKKLTTRILKQHKRYKDSLKQRQSQASK